MPEESEVEVCHVCLETFTAEALLKSHMQELHPDMETIMVGPSICTVILLIPNPGQGR